MSERKGLFGRANQGMNAQAQTAQILQTLQANQAQIAQTVQTLQTAQAAQTTQLAQLAQMAQITQIRPATQANSYALAIWLRHFERLDALGQLSALVPDVALMYQTLPSPYTPTDPSIHDLLSLLLLGQEQYPQALQEAEYGLTVLKNHPRLVHHKCLALLGLARNAKTDNEKVEILHTAAAYLEGFFKQCPKANENPDMAALEGHIFLDLWECQGNIDDLKQSWQAYERAWKGDKFQYYPAINYAVLYAMWLQKMNQDMTPIQKTLRDIIDLCITQRQGGELTFWIDFTAAQAHLALDHFSDAKDAYSSGLLHTPAPTSREWEAAMEGVARVKIINPHISDRAVQEIRDLRKPTAIYLQNLLSGDQQA